MGLFKRKKTNNGNGRGKKKIEDRIKKEVGKRITKTKSGVSKLKTQRKKVLSKITHPIKSASAFAKKRGALGKINEANDAQLSDELLENDGMQMGYQDEEEFEEEEAFEEDSREDLDGLAEGDEYEEEGDDSEEFTDGMDGDFWDGFSMFKNSKARKAQRQTSKKDKNVRKNDKRKSKSELSAAKAEAKRNGTDKMSQLKDKGKDLLGSLKGGGDEGDGEDEPKSKTGLYIGIAVGIAVLAIIAFMVLKKK